MELMGCGTALVTPFRRDGGVDEPALHALVNWQIESGIDFLVPCGTTGEASTLTEAEWLRVTETVVGAAAGRVPVFAGCTHNATHEAVAHVRKLSRIHGLNGILTANRSSRAGERLGRCEAHQPAVLSPHASQFLGGQPGSGEGCAADAGARGRRVAAADGSCIRRNTS